MKTRIRWLSAVHTHAPAGTHGCTQRGCGPVKAWAGEADDVKWTVEKFVPCWRGWQIWIRRARGHRLYHPDCSRGWCPRAKAELFRPATYSLTPMGYMAYREDYSCSMCVLQLHKVSHRLIYTICPSFSSRYTENRTHPTVWCTNDMVSVFKLIVFEAGNCINQSWHLFYDSLVLRAWVTLRPRDEWPLLPR